ncbi:hypothetical protein HPB50_028555 [Hyalomma asiaticum]|nr:hypothetical protein HPB50_028555 [Hyalomma asiaticum]
MGGSKFLVCTRNANQATKLMVAEGFRLNHEKVAVEAVGPPVTYVNVYRLPAYLPDDVLSNALQQYGKVKSVTFATVAIRQNKLNGTASRAVPTALPGNVRMILASAADKRLSELAELADSVLAVAPPSVAALQPHIAGRAPTTALHDIREQISRLADTGHKVMCCQVLVDSRTEAVPPTAGASQPGLSQRHGSRSTAGRYRWEGAEGASWEPRKQLASLQNGRGFLRQLPKHPLPFIPPQPEQQLMSTFKFATWNVSGFRDKSKQRDILCFAQAQGIDVLFIQEANFSSPLDVVAFRRDFCVDAFFSLTNSRASGVGVIFVTGRFRQKSHCTFGADGRMIMPDVYIEGKKVRSINSYAPVTRSDTNSFFKDLHQLLLERLPHVLLGDFNCVVDSQRDVRGPGRAVRRTKPRSWLRSSDT